MIEVGLLNYSDPFPKAQLNYYKTSDPIFTGEYRFLHPPVCGQTRVEALQEGGVR